MAKPTGGIVAASANIEGSPVSCPVGEWTLGIASLTIPSEEHELLVCWVRVWRNTTGQRLNGAVRLRAVIDGTTYYFPNSGVDYCPDFDAPPVSGWYARDSVMITIPRNMAGQTVYLDYCNFMATDNHVGKLVSWGHSAHCHR
jgi:hypothetical protein